MREIAQMFPVDSHRFKSQIAQINARVQLCTIGVIAQRSPADSRRSMRLYSLVLICVNLRALISDPDSYRDCGKLL